MKGAWEAGAWRIVGERALFELARPTLEQAATQPRRRGEWRLGSIATYYKGSPLALRPALRHATRAALGLAAFPRLQEFANLAWLRAHGFLAPRPLLAGVRRHAGLPRFQFLCTELLAGAPNLAEHLPAAAPARRAELLASLARDVARLHSLGFVHRDLYLRNLLAVEDEGAPRCAFVDAWRGGPRRGLRGPEHDLGCFFLDAAETLTSAEQALFLTTYRGECFRHGRTLSPDWPARVVRARAAVLRREGRRRPGLRQQWEFPRDV